MPLYVVATPIGNSQDLSQRALETLRNADIIIGEERAELGRLLKRAGIENKDRLLFLNEHTKKADVDEMVQLCKDHQIALVSDCGTPGFCDPGADLVRQCRQAGIEIKPLPGPSSVMCLISISGFNLKRFVFWGFLSAQNDVRAKEVVALSRERNAVVLMDTPYRMHKLLNELSLQMPGRQAILGCNLTQADEIICTGNLSEIARSISIKKAEFVLILSAL